MRANAPKIRGLQIEPGPEHGRVAERLEPECVNVIRQHGANAEYCDSQDHEQRYKNAPPPTRPINGDVSPGVQSATRF